MGSHRFRGTSRAKAITLVHSKGGAGKSVLTLNLMCFATELDGLKTVLIDADPTAQLTTFLLGEYTNQNITTAYDRVHIGLPIDDLLVYVPEMKLWLLPGDPRRALEDNNGAHLADLIEWVKDVYVADSLDPPAPADIVFVDLPGSQPKSAYQAFMSVDYVAVPQKASDIDQTSLPTLMHALQSARDARKACYAEDAPYFLGFIPNAVMRSAPVHREIVRQLAASELLLPFIPFSFYLQSTSIRGSRHGKKGVYYDAPQSSLVWQQFKQLWQAISDKAYQQTSDDLKKLEAYLA